MIVRGWVSDGGGLALAWVLAGSRLVLARLIHYGYRELDGAVIRQARREFTQEISLYVFTRADDAGAPRYSGIAYRSRLGDEFTNWAIFERPDRDPVRDATATDLSVDDRDLLTTFALFGLTLVDGRWTGAERRLTDGSVRSGRVVKGRALPATRPLTSPVDRRRP